MSDWAGVLEVWTWTYYSAEANTQIGRRMHQKFWGEGNGEGTPLPYYSAEANTQLGQRMRDPKMKNSEERALPRPFPNGEVTPLPCPTCIYYRRLCAQLPLPLHRKS